jgi:hypothetical protein
MIAQATERRLAGDWPGACAAARVHVAADLGEGLPQPALDDLRHLVPDLLRWHVPVNGYATWNWYSNEVPLARYPDGSALMVHTVWEPPPLQGLRLSFARSVPPAMVEIPRRLWDIRHAAELGDLRHSGLLGAEAAAAEGIDVDNVPDWFLNRPWIWPLLLPEARNLLMRLSPGRPDSGHAEPVLAVGFNVHLDLDGPRPRLHLNDPDSGRRPTSLPDGVWAEPLDATLLRLGHVHPGELHPLVQAALAPGTPHRRPPAPDTADVPCSGATHRLVLRDGALRALDHTDGELAREAALHALGGPMQPCAAILHSWHTGTGNLPRSVELIHEELWERIRHGDTDGARRLLSAGFPPVPDYRGRSVTEVLEEAERQLRKCPDGRCQSCHRGSR